MNTGYPTTLVVFGATGDLFRKKLAPALLKLYLSGKLPKLFKLVGFSRRDWDDKAFRQFLRENLADMAVSSQKLEMFFENVFYVKGNFDELPSYERVAWLLGTLDTEAGVCANKLFYLATPPGFYETILSRISNSGLAIPCAPIKVEKEGPVPLEAEGRFDPSKALTGWTRILVEKPFGYDLQSAQKIDDLLGKLFSEQQVFRIDHYLAKESLQSFLQFRFSHGVFDELWNKEHIERVEIKFFEAGGVSTRGDFYDSVGALRDVGQNHVLQMAALAAMEKPRSLSAADVQKARAAALEKFSLWSTGKTPVVLRGQYEGYRNEKGVAPNSQTETYFKVVLTQDTTGWRGVPFILEVGKKMPESKVEIVLQFKHPVGNVCPVGADCLEDNTVTFRVQDLLKTSTDTGVHFDAYEKVLLDAFNGDQTLFTSTDEVLSEWKIVRDIFKKWENTELVKYSKGRIPQA